MNNNYNNTGGYQMNRRPQPMGPPENGQEDPKKPQHRRTVDYFTPLGRYMIKKNVYNRRGIREPLGTVRPEMSYLSHLLPPSVEQATIVDITTKFVHISTNKARHAIHAIKWTPDARRVLVSSYSGEFTIWNGLTFNFESIMQAHDSPIFALEYSHDGDWLLTGDQEGTIKFWQPNFNNVNILTKSHDNAIQDLEFSPNDTKFVSCSDDQTLKIWNFSTATEERTLKGHHWDVKSCDWHGQLGLVVSGSKDNLVKFWDPRDASCITTMHDFKHTVTKVKFQKHGSQRLLAACSRDHSTKVFDIRTMRTLYTVRSHEDTDLSSISWHPIHSSLLTIGGYDGSLSFYDLDRALDPETIVSEPSDEHINLYGASSKVETLGDPIHLVPYAHEKAIYTMEYHPLGYILATAGADKSLRFWCRARPNDPFGYQDTAYTGESWMEKQQHFGDYHYQQPEEEAENRERAMPPPPQTLPGFSIPGLSN